MPSKSRKNKGWSLAPASVAQLYALPAYVELTCKDIDGS